MKNLDQKIFEVHKKLVNGIILIEMPSFKKNTEKNTHALYELRVLNKSTQHGDIQDKKMKKKIQINHTNYLYSLNEKKNTYLLLKMTH